MPCIVGRRSFRALLALLFAGFLAGPPFVVISPGPASQRPTPMVVATRAR